MIPKKRGSLFFTVDTMIGALILVFTIMVVVGVYVQPFETREPRGVLDNTVNFVTNQDMGSLVQNHAFVYANPREEFESFRLHQKIAYLHEQEDPTKATNFVENITRLTVPDHLGVRYIYNNTQIYSRGDMADFNTQLSRTVLTHYRNSSEEIVGPKVTRIMVLS